MRGEAWTDLTSSVMRAPFDHDEHGRLVRAHELMHARVSPLVADPFGAFPDLAAGLVEGAEEYRVNLLLGRVGFDLAALRDGSERLAGERLAASGEVGELVRFAAAVSGTGGFADLVRGVRRHSTELAATVRALDRALKECVRRVDTASLASTVLDESGLPRGFAVHTRRLAALLGDAVEGRVPARRGERRARPAPTGRFAPLLFDRGVVLDRRVPGARATRRVPAGAGRRVARPERLVTDPQRRCFERVSHRGGGVVLVDQSGSMALDESALAELLSAAPGSVVIGYSHAPGSAGVPNAWVLADRGRVASALRAGNVGNGVDGPALRAALRRRRGREPVLWVCDGQVTDSSDHADLALARECADLVLRHGVAMVGTLEAALAVLRRGPVRRGGPRLLGRVGASVTALP